MAERASYRVELYRSKKNPTQTSALANLARMRSPISRRSCPGFAACSALGDGAALFGAALGAALFGAALFGAALGAALFGAALGDAALPMLHFWLGQQAVALSCGE